MPLLTSLRMDHKQPTLQSLLNVLRVGLVRMGGGSHVFNITTFSKLHSCTGFKRSTKGRLPGCV